jgi:hypothetical protein
MARNRLDLDATGPGQVCPGPAVVWSVRLLVENGFDIEIGEQAALTDVIEVITDLIV